MKIEMEVNNGIPYLLGSDNLFYPQLAGDYQNTEIGRFGSLMESWLLEEQPERCQELLTQGKLLEYLQKTNNECWEKSERIQEQFKQQTPPPKDADFLKMVQYNQQIQDTANEIVQSELFPNN